MEEIKLKGGIFITTKDIQILHDCALRSAQRLHKEMRENLSLKKMTVIAYCEYWGVNYKMVIECINPYR